MSNQETDRTAALAALSDFDQLCVEAFEYSAANRGVSQVEQARRLGLDRGTYRNRLEKYHARDLGGKLPGGVAPGHEIVAHTRQFNAEGALTSESIKTSVRSSDTPFKVPDGHRVKGVSALLDGTGAVKATWFKTTEGERSDEAIHEAAKLAAAMHVKPAEPLILRPKDAREHDKFLVNLHPLPDLHLGLKTTRGSGQTDWDLPKAMKAYKRLMRLLMDRAPAAATGIILGGGDLLHFDDDTRRTRQSGNDLEGADPYAVVLANAEDLLVYQVELALRKYNKVVVRILKGNHDPDSAIAVAHYLAAWFRNEPRVTVDRDDSDLWFYQAGKVFLAACHGHNAKITQLPGLMAADRARIWGETLFRHAHGFHVHHLTKGADEGGGASWETHETPVPRDTYHQQKGYRAAQSMCVISYHHERGETGRSMETLIG